MPANKPYPKESSKDFQDRMRREKVEKGVAGATQEGYVDPNTAEVSPLAAAAAKNRKKQAEAVANPPKK